MTQPHAQQSAQSTPQSAPQSAHAPAAPPLPAARSVRAAPPLDRLYGTPGWLTGAQLKRRGWTWQQMMQALGDGVREPNPFDASGHPLRLYRLEDVERAEADPRFQLTAALGLPHERFPASGSRELAGKEALTRRDRALALTLSGDFTLPELSGRELGELSRAYGQLRGLPRRMQDKPRNMLNTLRHNATPYDQALQGKGGPGSLGRTGRASQAQHREVLRLIVSAISWLYPQLRRACQAKLQRSGAGQVMAPDALPGRLGAQVRARVAAQLAAAQH